jgi:hypothetical protein
MSAVCLSRSEFSTAMRTAVLSVVKSRSAVVMRSRFS